MTNKMAIKKKLTIVLERDDDNDWQAWCDVEDAQTLLTAIAPDTEGVVLQMKDLIKGFQQNEWHDVASWATVNADTDIEFEFAYSVVELFDTFNFLKISAVAKEAGLNASLLRAYASGDKNPSLRQAQKIEDTIRRLGQSLIQAIVVPPPLAA